MTQPPEQLKMEASAEKLPTPPPPPPRKEETVDAEKSEGSDEISELDHDIQMADQWSISSQTDSARPVASEAEVELSWSSLPPRDRGGLEARSREALAR